MKGQACTGQCCGGGNLHTGVVILFAGHLGSSRISLVYQDVIIRKTTCEDGANQVKNCGGVVVDVDTGQIDVPGWVAITGGGQQHTAFKYRSGYVPGWLHRSGGESFERVELKQFCGEPSFSRTWRRRSKYAKLDIARFTRLRALIARWPALRAARAGTLLPCAAGCKVGCCDAARLSILGSPCWCSHPRGGSAEMRE